MNEELKDTIGTLEDGSNANKPIEEAALPDPTIERSVELDPNPIFKEFADAIQADSKAVPAAGAPAADDNVAIEAAVKPAKDEMVKIQQKAVIEWLDDAGNITSTETHWRGAVPLFMYISDKAREDKDTLKRCVRICLKSADINDKQVFVIGEGTLLDVLEKLNNRIIFAPNAMSQLQLIIAQMSELSDLKGIMITAVFGPETPQVAGFGFTSESTEVTDADIRALATATAGQLDMFKTKMRNNRGVTFDDDSRIIIPGKR